MELDDHVAFLKYAAKTTGLIDLSRVAIMGYSFGKQAIVFIYI